MKIIETSTSTTAVNAIRERLHLLGIHRITAVRVLDLGKSDAPPHRLCYRGTSVEVPASVLQIRLLVADSMADQAVAALRWLASTRGCPLGEIIVFPVEGLFASSHVAALGESPQPETVNGQS